MAAETRHAGLTADERSDIRSTVLEARELIEDDLYRQLERYGVYEDERVNLDQLGHLDAYDRQTRRTIDAALNRELEATEGDYQRSVENYVREATKTYLNRLVALKAIEVRGLVTETLMERPEYGNRSEMLRTVDEVAGELTDQRDGGQSAALELAYTELTDEIGVIFEESEHTAIDLDFAVREDVIEQLNEIDESVWESDEAMGWVYQYFGEKEREEIDDRIDEENYKVRDTDVATKTQLFTPRYIVEWMVDNSLGRLWLEMHGENTNIDDEDNCFYLAPLEESLNDRDAKNVQDLKVLDPACGSGHMLFYAFDVLYEMYLDQGDIAEKYIPRKILKHNLYGIDIDPGAAQLAALSLYVKAKSEEPDVDIEQINIVSADAVLVNGEKKEEVLARAETELEERVLEQVWRSFEHVREWGSLVRIEERIEEIIDEELEEIRATGQTQFTADGLEKQSSVMSFSGEEESWEQVKERLLSEVSELAEEALERNDPIEEMFVDEVEKSVRLLEYFLTDFDIVVTNPPYLTSGKMGNDIKEFTKSNYISSGNLYAAFVERCIEFTRGNAYTSLVTPDSFMFQYSYRKLRPQLINSSQIIEGAHLARYGFDNQKDRYIIPFVLKNSDPEGRPISRFYRMTQEQEKYAHYKDKITGLEDITRTHRESKTHTDVYKVDQLNFTEIGRSPFIYWMGKEVLNLFPQLNKLGDISVSGRGLQTGDNDKFTRKFWEVPRSEVGKKYEFFQKSGTDNPYYDFPTDLVLWGSDGEYLKSQGNPTDSYSEYYFEEVVTFRRFGKLFTARINKNDMIFDINSPFIYSERISNAVLLGILNSSLSRFIMNGINPGMNFQPGDAKQVPIKDEYSNEKEIKEKVELAISQQQHLGELDETTAIFDPELFLSKIRSDISLHLHQDLIHSVIEHIMADIDSIIFKEYEILNKTSNKILDDLPTHPRDSPHYSNAIQNPIPDNHLPKDVEIIHQEVGDKQDIIEGVNDESGDIIEISRKLNVSPYTISMIRHEYDLYSSKRLEKTGGRILSYVLGEIFDRWNELGIQSESDGILAFGDSFETNVSNRINRWFELAFEDSYKVKSDIEDLVEMDLVEWFNERLFRYHHCKEYRRRGQRIPIYWQLESDEEAFSCFIYYHKMDDDTFSKLRGQYIDKKLDTLQNRLEAIESELEAADGDQARDLRSEKEEIEADIDDITEFRNRVDVLIDEGFEPDFEAGIWENIQKVDEHDLLAVPLDKL